MKLKTKQMARENHKNPEKNICFLLLLEIVDNM